jgi:uncharacterized protein
MASPLVVNTVELLRRPGTERPLTVSVTAAELDIDDPRVAPQAVIDVAVRLEVLSDGIVVDGAVRAPWTGECRRCLRPVSGTIDGEVRELYQATPTDPDAFAIEHDQLDLRPMVREVVLIDLPDGPLCRPDCAGLCPVCGADRNEVPCGCDTGARDDRWSVLDVLKDRPDVGA